MRPPLDERARSGKPELLFSRGGAVAMNINSGFTPLVLLCPAWKRWGTATAVKSNAVILHSRADDVVPFADSQELVRNSGLPKSALIVVGTDHRLADPEPLKAMLEAVRLAVPTLCLGIDVTWWGGSPRYRDSQRDTIVHAVVQHGLQSDVQFATANLSRAPNPRSDQPTEANFDADARLLAGGVSRILQDNREGRSRCIVALKDGARIGRFAGLAAAEKMVDTVGTWPAAETAKVVQRLDRGNHLPADLQGAGQRHSMATDAILDRGGMTAEVIFQWT